MLGVPKIKIDKKVIDVGQQFQDRYLTESKTKLIESAEVKSDKDT